MKYLVLIGVVLVVYLLWRSKRGKPGDESPQMPATPAALPQDMVRCPVCSVHLPRADALPDAQGHLYCSNDHRLIGGKKGGP